MYHGVFILVSANQIQPDNYLAFVGGYVELLCEGRSPVWFYSNKLDTPPTVSISTSRILSFRATKEHDGYYFCYAMFPQQDRHFLSMVRVQVVKGKFKVCQYIHECNFQC